MDAEPEPVIAQRRSAAVAAEPVAPVSAGEPPWGLDRHLTGRLQAAYGWASFEAGGVDWSRFVEAVLEAGLDDLPRVIARLRADVPPHDSQPVG
jgi:hypothetical protein